MENSPYIQEELMQFVRGEVEWLTYQGEPFDKAVTRVRQQLIDAVDASLIVAGLWRDFDRAALAKEDAGQALVAKW